MFFRPRSETMHAMFREGGTEERREGEGSVWGRVEMGREGERLR